MQNSQSHTSQEVRKPTLRSITAKITPPRSQYAVLSPGRVSPIGLCDGWPDPEGLPNSLKPARIGRLGTPHCANPRRWRQSGETTS